MKSILYEEYQSACGGDIVSWAPALLDGNRTVHFFNCYGDLTSLPNVDPNHIKPLDTQAAMRTEFETAVRIASDRYGARFDAFLKNLEKIAAIRKAVAPGERNGL